MLMAKDIIQEGNPEQNKMLRKRSADVALPLSIEDKNILISMMEYIVKSQNPVLAEELGLRPAVGLAAPQIGVNKRMFCMNTADEKNEVMHTYAVANPKIISYSVEQTCLKNGEGCLSVDEAKNGLVSRSQRIKTKVHLFDLATGKEADVLLKLSGYPAVVFQHEYDHLQGVLFIDKVKETLPNVKPILFVEDEPDENSPK
jgi:peptide deformylase